MGTLNYTLGYYAGDNNKNLIGTALSTSDAFTSSTTAANVTDGSGAIAASVGQVFRAVIDEDAWIAFGGRTATVGNDFFMRANVEYDWEISVGDSGAVSIIDVA